MATKREDATRRLTISKILKRYFDDLTRRLAAGTAEFWSRIEQRQRLLQNPATSEPDLRVPPGVMATPMQQQPEQQQQSKAEEKK